MVSEVENLKCSKNALQDENDDLEPCLLFVDNVQRIL